MPYLSEEEIAGGILNKYTPRQLPETQSIEQERTFGGTLQDVGVSLGKGLVGTGQAVVGLADIPTMGYTGKGLEELGIDLEGAQEYLSEQYTPAQQAAFERVAQKGQEAAPGMERFLATLGSAIQNPSTIVHSVVESLPMMAGGGLVGKGLMKAGMVASPLVAGALGEGTVAAGSMAEQTRGRTEEGLLTPKQAAMAVGTGVGTGALGLLGGKIAQKLGIGDVDTMLASGRFAEKSNKGVVRRILEGGISEGVFEELPQSAQEQIWSNAALGQPLLDGIEAGMAQGLLAGAAMGGGVNVFTGQAQPEIKGSAREQLIDIDRKIVNLESLGEKQKTEESQKNLNDLYQQRDDLLRQIRGIDQQTEETQIDQETQVAPDYISLPTDLNEINQQIENLVQSGATNPGAINLLNQLYEQREKVSNQVFDEEVARRGEAAQRESKRLGARPEPIEMSQDEILWIQNREDRQAQMDSLMAETLPQTPEEATRITEQLQQDLQFLEQQETDLDAKADNISKQRQIRDIDNELKNVVEQQNQIRDKNSKKFLKLDEQRKGLNNQLAEIFTDTDRIMAGRFQRDFEIGRAEREARLDEVPTEEVVLTQPELTPAVTEVEQPVERAVAVEEIVPVEKAITAKPETIIQYSPADKHRRFKALNEMLRTDVNAGETWQMIEANKDQFTPEEIQRLRNYFKQNPVETTKATINDVAQIAQIPSLMDYNKQDIGFEQIIEESQTIQDPQTSIEDFQAREDLISEMESELEANQIEQERLGVDNPIRGELELNAEELRERIRNDRRELLIDRLANRGQFEIRSAQEPGQGIALPEIQKMYKGQEVFQGDDGAISVRFKNGQGATIQNIQDAGNGFISYAIDTGQMSKEGKILGVTTGTNILLDSEFADNATLWHENKHVLDNLGMITEKDNSLLNKEFNKLRKANRLNFGLSTHEDPRQAMAENRANMFAQIMVEREAYRNTPLGKVIQKIMDFFNGLLGIGRQTLGGFVREVESGKIYERPTNQIEQELSQKSFSTITDQELIKKLDSVPKIKFYRAMQLIDGNLYPPMSAKVEGKLREPTKLGVWEIADERPELADDKGMFKLDKANKSAIKARYNPYFHSSPSPLNDQFSSAYARPNLVTVEIEVPESELTGNYQAEKAKDSVGLKNWHAGPVSSKLPKGKKRTVMLSRYAKMNRIVPDSEVAQTIANLLEGENLSIPDHVVTPSLREELQKLGVPITRSKQVQKAIDKGQFEEYDINKITPQFQVADLTKPEQKISDDAYRDVYAQQSSLVEKLNQNIKKTGREINRGMNKYLGMISTNLKKINPILESKVRKLGFDTTQAIKNDLTVAKPLLDKLKDMSPQDKSDWHWARVNGDKNRINQITEKYGMTTDYNNVRESLNRIRRDGEAVGYNIGFIDEYWPRILKDRTGFLQATRELSNEPVFSIALKAQADKQGITVDQLDDGLKADIISNIILGRPSGLGGPVNIRQRYFAEVPPEFAKFYMDSDAALMSYIYAMNKKIETRKFFGKVPERIARIKKDKRTKETRLANLTRLESDLVADGQDTTTVKEQINDLVGDIQIAQNELDKYGRQDDFKENIGSYVMDLMVQEKIKPGTGVKENDEQALKDILTARFNEKGTTGLANVYKNLAYIDTMGNPISTITQLGDLAWAVYVGGLTPRGIANSVKNIGKAIIGKSNITREDIGITRIAQEFADGDTLSNKVSKIFKIVGIEKLDRIGKEALINNSFDNYRAKAEIATRDAKEMERFKKELRPIFGSKSEKVINDLLDPNVAEQSDDVKLLVYSRLLDFQPADLSETPEAYLNAGNGRLFYMLKMFTLKQFDVFRREVWHNIKTGERDKVLTGLGNMTRLMAVLSLANASADELKDWVLGKDTKFEDHVIENLLSLGGASRYLRMQTTREGIGSGLAGQILPPFKFIDAISKDVMTDTRDGLRSVDSIPVGGKLYYWHFGRGKDNRESVEEKDFAKESKKIKKFKKDFDAADDKRLFLRSNLDQFKQMKFYDNMTKAIRGNKATINKLKNIEQTTNVRKRLSQLEQQRKDLINRYFEMKNNI